MGTIAKVTAGGATHLIASTAYATCPTGAGTAAKVATIQDSQAFTLIDGVTVHVYFTYSNTASSPTLNVNSTGAKAIYKYGNTAAGTTENDSWPAGSVVSFTYNKNGASGGCWTINNFQIAASQQNADWNASTGVSSILNKPTIPAAQVNANWTASTGVASILNKPSIPSTYSDVGAASAAHAHGALTSDGKITTEVEIATGDHLLITDSSDSSKVKRSTITFANQVDKFLRNDGVWANVYSEDVAIESNGAYSGPWLQDALDDLHNRAPIFLELDWGLETPTPATLYSHFNAGRTVILYYDDDSTMRYYYPVDWYYSSENSHEFIFVGNDDDDKIRYFTIKNGTWNWDSPGYTYQGTAPISVSGSNISHNSSGVTSGTYGLTYSNSQYYIPSFTVDSTGHLTNVTATGSYFNINTTDTYFTNYGFKTSIGTIYSLPSSATSTSVTITDVSTNSAFYITDVMAIDGTTHEPLMVDWSASSAATTSNTLTVSVASNYTNIIYFWPVIKTYTKVM